MITPLRPKRTPVSMGVCLRFTACARGGEFDSRVDGGREAVAVVVVGGDNSVSM